MWFWEFSGLDVDDVVERLFDGCVDVGGRVIGAECLVAENLDATVVEVEADLVGDLPEVLAVEQLDGIGIIVLLEAVGVLPSRVRKPAGRDDHSAFGAVEVERRDRRVELLDDWSPDRPRVLALDDNRTPGAVDDFLHDDVATLVSRAVGLADVLVAEIAEDVLYHVLELEP